MIVGTQTELIAKDNENFRSAHKIPPSGKRSLKVKFKAKCFIFPFLGGPVKRNVPLAQGMSGIPQDTQIGTEQGVVSVAPNNANTNNNNANNDAMSSNVPDMNGNNVPTEAVANTGATDAGMANTGTANEGTAGASLGGTAEAANAENTNRGPPTVEAKLDEGHQVKPVAEKGELQQTMIHPGGEVEKVYTGTPEQVANNHHKGVKDPIHTIVKPDGEIEKVYVGTPTENKKILDKDKNVKEGRIQGGNNFIFQTYARILKAHSHSHSMSGGLV